eukprot:m.46223 g.46223  ORF g.46223 m.46223 type:complete len:395 (+) comp33682_c0_seq13:2044-3228(+)
MACSDKSQIKRTFQRETRDDASDRQEATYEAQQTVAQCFEETKPGVKESWLGSEDPFQRCHLTTTSQGNSVSCRFGSWEALGAATDHLNTRRYKVQTAVDIKMEDRTERASLENQVKTLTRKLLKMEKVMTEQLTRIRCLEAEIQLLSSRIRKSDSVELAEGKLCGQKVKMFDHGSKIRFADCKQDKDVLLWKITEVHQRRKEAVNGRSSSVCSQSFCIGAGTHKLYVRSHLDGHGMGKGSHLSLYFVVTKGDYDAFLPSSFQLVVTLTLIDQQTNKRHLSSTFWPDPKGKKAAIGCPLFAPLAVLEDGPYVIDDAMLIQISVRARSHHNFQKNQDRPCLKRISSSDLKIKKWLKGIDRRLNSLCEKLDQGNLTLQVTAGNVMIGCESAKVTNH